MRAARVARDFVIVFVARKALPAVGLGRRALEADDFGRLTPAVDMRLAGAVAGFARILDLDERALIEDRVRIFFKSLDYFLVTGGAVLHGGFGLLGLGPGQQPVGIAGQDPDSQGCHEGHEKDLSITSKCHVGPYRACDLLTAKSAVSLWHTVQDSTCPMLKLAVLRNAWAAVAVESWQEMQAVAIGMVGDQ